MGSLFEGLIVPLAERGELEVSVSRGGKGKQKSCRRKGMKDKHERESSV